jgi:hypothetical protein
MMMMMGVACRAVSTQGCGHGSPVVSLLHHLLVRKAYVLIAWGQGSIRNDDAIVKVSSALEPYRFRAS